MLIGLLTSILALLCLSIAYPSLLLSSPNQMHVLASSGTKQNDVHHAWGAAREQNLEMHVYTAGPVSNVLVLIYKAFDDLGPGTA